MKILVINSLYYPNIIGGAELSVQLLAESLVKLGFEPVVVSVSDKEYEDIVNGVKVYYIKHSNLYWLPESKTKKRIVRMFWHIRDVYNPAIAKNIARIIDVEKPLIAHTNNLCGLSVSVWKILKEKNIPIIHTLRDYYLLCYKSTMFSNGKICKKQCLNCKILSYIKKDFSKYVNFVTGISRFILDKHLKAGYFKKSKPYVIFNQIANIYNRDRERIKSQLVFAYVGALEESKGLMSMLNSFNSLGDCCKLIVCGRAKTEKHEKELIEKYSSKNIEFLGFVDSKKIFPEVDVLVVPSLWNEAFSRVIIEAYSHGVPVIASNRGGIPEIVEEGKTGFIFEPTSQKDLEEKVMLFVRSPGIISNMSKNCLNKSKYFLDMEIASRYIEIYMNSIDKDIKKNFN